MQSGALGTIEATKLATGTEDEIRLEIHGARGAVRFKRHEPHPFGTARRPRRPEQPLGGLRGWNRIDAGQRYPSPATAFPDSQGGQSADSAATVALPGGNFLEAVAQGPRPPSLDWIKGFASAA